MLLLCFLSILAFRPLPDKKAPERDVADLQGVWKAVKVEFDGKEQKPEDIAGVRITFSGRSFALSERGTEDLHADFSIGADKNPRYIDVEIKTGINKGKQSLGIYEIRGKTLTLCFRRPMADRPTGFVSKNEATLMLLEME